MSERSREHIHPVMLNATFYVGITKLSASLECSKSAAILFALNEGLRKENVISQEDYELLKQRYGRKLKDVITESQVSKENSHISKLELERQKRAEIIAKINDQKPGLSQNEKNIKLVLKGMVEDWDRHKDLNNPADLKWRANAIKFAEDHPDNENAKILLAKERECAI